MGDTGGRSTANGSLTAICVTHAVRDFGARLGRSGIDKRPVDGPVAVGPTGLAGDEIIDLRWHGGLDQAVYVYADEDADVWAADLARATPPGWFGENLRVAGIAVSGAVIGERWQVGQPGTGPLLELTSPRTPCAKFQRHTAEKHWVKRFAQAGLTGAYFRVVEPGTIRLGDDVAVVARPRHGVTVRGWYTGHRPADAAALMAADQSGEIRLQAAFRPEITKALAAAG